MCQSEDTVFLKKREFKDVKGPVDFIKYFFQDVVLTKHGRCLPKYAAWSRLDYSVPLR